LKILYVSSHDLVGQQFNGYLLLNALREMGIDARMFVHESQVDRPQIVYHPENRTGIFINRVLSYLEKRLSLYGILPTHSFDIVRNHFYKEADIVHLQLIHASQFFSLLSLPQIGRQKKLVLTLHDPWMLTGHCVHPMESEGWKTGCGNCPDLARPFPIHKDTTAFTWRLKKQIMERTKVHLVVASAWMDQLVASSPILSHLPRSIIPLGLDTRVFKPRDKNECRDALGIPREAFVIAFRAVPFSPFKGTEYIEQALAGLSTDRPVYLILFDSKGLMPGLTERYPALELGWLNDSETIVQALNAADLFLMPSLAEAFGMMAVESMACGTPVIVFEGTALPSVVKAPRGGIVVPARDADALRFAVECLMNDPVRYQELVRNGLEIIQEEYTIEKYISRHLALYQTLINDAQPVA
jgi:glycosyltransferase involved in cell wall biosynthesis